ncbi:DNA pilot protein [Chicken microvirus mg7_20]|nr:DNA pilot protein [Chicken microvirus mg7_20]
MGLFDGLAGSVVGAVGSLIGGGISSSNASSMAADNYRAQREFAQNGIRWRVADAKAAGVHPLFALGASGAQFSPVQAYTGDYGISDAASKFGQGIDRAAQAKMTKQERDRLTVREALADAAMLEDIKQKGERHRAELGLIRSEIARNMASSRMALANSVRVPAMPTVGYSGSVIPGQGDSYATGQTEREVSTVPTSEKGKPSVQAGTPPDVRFYRTSTGRTPLPTEEAADAIDAAFGAGIQWSLRNNLLPYLANFFPINDPHRREGEYYDLIFGQYRKGKRIRDYFGY